MTANPQPDYLEVTLGQKDIILTALDLQGRITYASQTLRTFARYTDAELLGKPFETTWHADVPRYISQLLRERLADGRDFNGYIKNVTKDGLFYWTFANVTPTHDGQRQRTGYLAVQRAPDPITAQLVDAVYAFMAVPGGGGDCESAAKVLNDFMKPMNYDEFILRLEATGPDQAAPG
jgi:PAS domain S-box-containing protein